MEEGYEEIDKLFADQNANLEQQQNLQNEIIDKGLQKVQNETEKQKIEYEKEAEKTAKGLHTEYRKQANPYGATAEILASQGLNKSGYAETTQANLFSAHQRDITELVNTTRQLKADVDFQFNQALIDADVQKAQSALTLYQQKAQLALQEYDMKFTREQFNYQKERDRIQDEQWERSFALQQQQAQQSQANWEKEYALSLRNSSRQ